MKTLNSRNPFRARTVQDLVDYLKEISGPRDTCGGWYKVEAFAKKAGIRGPDLVRFCVDSGCECACQTRRELAELVGPQTLLPH